MKRPIIQDYNRDHWRFRNTCDNFHPVPDSPSWVWLLTAFVITVILLALVFV
jgi:hypothetical protein